MPAGSDIWAPVPPRWHTAGEMPAALAVAAEEEEATVKRGENVPLFGLSILPGRASVVCTGCSNTSTLPQEARGTSDEQLLLCHAHLSSH